MKINLNVNHHLLLMIVIAGSILRTWHLLDIPFTHDEFSVIYRTGYDSFSDLIDQGVMVDVHPAGVQVFVNYWVALFGDSTVAVKIPFILFGIFSILLVYKIGEEWYNASVGLLSAVFVSCLEYTVMHSQIARPYMSGLFFSLLMVYAWQRYLFKAGKYPLAWLSLYVITSAISAYNHHFSMMFAAIIGISGLFYIGRRRLITYISAGVAIFALYIPNLSILIHQFEGKGVGGWLGKPGNDFIFNYIGYIFHFSPFVYILVVIIIIAGIWLNRGLPVLKNKFFYISLAWFSIPILVGFFYSRYVNPVLQYRVLIFSFPFFLFILFGNLPDLKKPVKYLAIPLLCFTLILTLIYGRQYYSLFYQSRFKHLVIDTAQSIDKYGTENCLVIMDSHKRITELYFETLDIRFNHLHYDDFNNRKEFIDLIKSSKREYLSLAVDSRTDLALPGIIMQYFPNIILKKDYYGGNYYLFSKNHVNKMESCLFLSRNDFSGVETGWSLVADSLLVDTGRFSGNSAYHITKEQEWSTSFSYPLRELVNRKNDMIDVSVSILNLDTLNQSMLVLVVNGKRGLIEWTASPFQDFDPGQGDCYTVHHTFRTTHNPRRKDLSVNVYIWNKDKITFLGDNFKISSRKGNPVIYGLLEKF